jgi:hypothetical protein
MTEQSEWQFIVDYVKDSTTDFCNATCRSQLMALWTAYCMHNSLEVDTIMYDVELIDLWNAIPIEHRRELHCSNWGEFDDLMGAWMA